jgi:hypothetical protein
MASFMCQGTVGEKQCTVLAYEKHVHVSAKVLGHWFFRIRVKRLIILPVWLSYYLQTLASLKKNANFPFFNLSLYFQLS